MINQVRVGLSESNQTDILTKDSHLLQVITLATHLRIILLQIMPLYFCAGQVLSRHIYFYVKCQLCFRERSGMRLIFPQHNDNVILKHLRGKFTLKPQIGLKVVLNCLASLPIKYTQEN